MFDEFLEKVRDTGMPAFPLAYGNPVSSAYGLLRAIGEDPYEDIKTDGSEPYYTVKERPLNDPENEYFRGLSWIMPVARHHHFFGSDGSNTGFGSPTHGPGQGKVGEEFSETPDMDKYYKETWQFGDSKYKKSAIDKGLQMRRDAYNEVERMAREDPDMYGDIADMGRYDLLLNNCHDYITDAMWRGSGRSGR